jgi:hypothetical protein
VPFRSTRGAHLSPNNLPTPPPLLHYDCRINYEGSHDEKNNIRRTGAIDSVRVRLDTGRGGAGFARLQAGLLAGFQGRFRRRLPQGDIGAGRRPGGVEGVSDFNYQRSLRPGQRRELRREALRCTARERSLQRLDRRHQPDVRRSVAGKTQIAQHHLFLRQYGEDCIGIRTSHSISFLRLIRRPAEIESTPPVAVSRGSAGGKLIRSNLFPKRKETSWENFRHICISAHACGQVR